MLQHVAATGAEGGGREPGELRRRVPRGRAVLEDDELGADPLAGEDREDDCAVACLDDAAELVEHRHPASAAAERSPGTSGSTKTSISPPQERPTSSAISSVMP